jgi:hypothetical protein
MERPILVATFIAGCFLSLWAGMCAMWAGQRTATRRRMGEAEGIGYLRGIEDGYTQGKLMWDKFGSDDFKCHSPEKRLASCVNLGPLGERSPPGDIGSHG